MVRTRTIFDPILSCRATQIHIFAPDALPFCRFSRCAIFNFKKFVDIPKIVIQPLVPISSNQPGQLYRIRKPCHQLKDGQLQFKHQFCSQSRGQMRWRQTPAPRSDQIIKFLSYFVLKLIEQSGKHAANWREGSGRSRAIR